MRYVDTQQIKAAFEISGYKMSLEMVRYYIKRFEIKPVAKIGRANLYLDSTIGFLLDYLIDKEGFYYQRY